MEKIEKKDRKAADEKFKKDKINKGLNLDPNLFYQYQDFALNEKTAYFDYELKDHGKGKLVCHGIAKPMIPRRKYMDFNFYYQPLNDLHFQECFFCALVLSRLKSTTQP